MFLFLAQASPPPAAVASWVEVIFYLAGGVTMIVVLIKQLSGKSDETKITPQPLEVKEHQRFTPIEKHEELAERVDRLDDQLDDRMKELAQASSQGREKIYKQLTEQRTLIAENTQKTDLTYAQVQSLDQKIDRLLSRPIVHTTT